MSKKELFTSPIFWEVRIKDEAKLTREEKAFYRRQISRQFAEHYKTEAAAKAAITRKRGFHHLNLVASEVMYLSF